ncbi:hypothetical protein K437DRAFT_253707 [Tilletiaria anomala UBC 951]|uniref:Sas10 C-terminal domain-containing protein n=1 Tax=Tilletiaria anomala (strain ATCC 24038 / CBS 436.72 / UBC 951) TaxID=1037660 RepID=A0A066WQ82_TILAU|nr:uncharacterized protein K437DRAFT_253707 [Tilletiaria anomala UBC 951]KDN52780.1 hypothetical protein K437DRAFT_253707 [Tilletiaria anomala UBC 951]
MDAEAVAQVAQTLALARTDTAALFTSLTKLQQLLGSGTEGTSGSCADGPSLLTLKVDTILSYTHALLLRTLQRILPAEGGDRGVVGVNTTNLLVEHLIRSRLILEKSKPLENKLRHHIGRLLSAAVQHDEDVRLGRKAHQPADGEEAEEDLLAYGPNPSAVISRSKNKSESRERRSFASKGKAPQAEPESDEEDDGQGRGGVYRPPKIAPVAYDPDALSKRKSKEHRRRLALGGEDDLDGDGDAYSSSSRRNRALLSEFTTSLSANPYEQSSTGTGINRPNASTAAASSHAGGSSKRAAELARMEAYEEANFTRLILNKKEERRRRRDEEDLALGGARGRRGRSGQSAGFEAELGGLLGSAGGNGSGGKSGKRKASAGAGTDSYDVLRRAKAPRTGRSSSAAGARDLGGRKFEHGLKKLAKGGSRRRR